jgi:hypothetical protein
MDIHIHFVFPKRSQGLLEFPGIFARTKASFQTSAISPPWLTNVLKTAIEAHFWDPEQDPLGEFIAAANGLIVPALHYSLIFVERAAGLLDTVLARLGIGAVDPAYLWTANPPSAKYMLSSAMETLREYPDLIRAWQDEAFRWAVGCSDVEPGFRSLYVFNSIWGSSRRSHCRSSAMRSSFTSRTCLRMTHRALSAMSSKCSRPTSRAAKRLRPNLPPPF